MDLQKTAKWAIRLATETDIWDQEMLVSYLINEVTDEYTLDRLIVLKAELEQRSLVQTIETELEQLSLWITDELCEPLTEDQCESLIALVECDLDEHDLVTTIIDNIANVIDDSVQQELLIKLNSLTSKLFN